MPGYWVYSFSCLVLSPFVNEGQETSYFSIPDKCGCASIVGGEKKKIGISNNIRVYCMSTVEKKYVPAQGTAAYQFAAITVLVPSLNSSNFTLD